jgi:hypothetical protein
MPSKRRGKSAHAHGVSDTDDSGGETQLGERAPSPIISGSALQALAQVIATAPQAARTVYTQGRPPHGQPCRSARSPAQQGSVALECAAHHKISSQAIDGALGQGVQRGLAAQGATGDPHSSAAETHDTESVEREDLAPSLPLSLSLSFRDGGTSPSRGEGLGAGSPDACSQEQFALRRHARLALVEAEGPGLGIPTIGADGRCPDFHLRISDGKYVGSICRIPSIAELPGIGRSRRNAICLLADDQVSRFQV